MNLILDLPTGFVPILAGGEELVVWGLDVADMCKHSKAYGLFLEIPCGGRAPHPSAVLEAGVFCDYVLRSGRAARKQLTHSLRKTLDVILVEIRAPLRLALSMTCARVSIGQALRFGPRKSGLLDQHTLPFVTVTGAAPLEDHSGQRGVLSGPARQRRVPGRQENEVVEVRRQLKRYRRASNEVQHCGNNNGALPRRRVFSRPSFSSFSPPSDVFPSDLLAAVWICIYSAARMRFALPADVDWQR